MHRQFLSITAALALTAGASFAARAAEVGVFAGGALFAGKNGIQTYYAQVSDGKTPLLKTYIFLASEHFYVLLRQTQPGGGTVEYQSFANGGATHKGRGTFTITGTNLKAAGSKGFRLTMKMTGARIGIQYRGLNGNYHAAGSLKRF